MLGIALGVAALIIVLSVMNGFQKEVRDRMLEVLPHIEVQSVFEEGLPDVAAWQARLASQPHVLASAPYVATQGLITRGDAVRGVMLRGIDPAQEVKVTPLAQRGNSAAALQRLQPAEFGVVLGVALARNMGVVVGDVVSLVLPSGDLTAMGLMPRTKTLTVVGVFDSGHFEYDSGMAFLHVNDMQRLMRMTGPTGVRVALDDVHLAGRVAQSLQSFLGPDVWVSDWTQQNRNWFAAVQVEKRMMGIILTLIVAVAAFNLVSTLVMTVTDKRADIAILRTLGATPGSIMAIFMVQGAVAGVLGTLFGLLLGLSVALNLDVIVPAIEAVLGVSFLPQEIYLINQMPSDPQSADIVPVVWTSLLLAFVATLYPSWRASQVQPAEALRYE